MSISWNWQLDKPLAFVDFETASKVNLREVGSHAYVRDPSTRLLSAVWRIGNSLVTWCPRLPAPLLGVLTGDEVPASVLHIAERYIWIAHNAEGFDAMLWASLYPDVPVEWADSMHLCRVAGLPASLDGAAKALGLPGKDAEGAKIMKLMTSRPDAIGTVPLWEKLLKYNVQDVESLVALWGHVASGPIPVAELALHSQVNERGVLVDRKFAEALHRTWVETKIEARDEIAIATGGKLTAAKASSNAAVHAWLKSVGVSVSSLRRDFLASLLDDPESLGAGDDETAALAAHVLKLRADVVRAGEGKVARLVGTLDADDRLRRMFVFHGAGTGRFSSRVVQVHNLPRGVECDVESLTSRPLTPEAIREESTRSGASVSDILASLVRPCFIAREGTALCISDFSSVEARCVAWMAGESGLLATFAAGGDVYCDFATGLYGRPIADADKLERQLGKVAILGLGYMMGHANFARVCKNQRIDLDAAGVTAEQCVKAYRGRYPQIPRLWRNMNDAAMNAVRAGGVYNAGWCRFYMKGLNLHATLPSGREIIYRDARIECKVPRWAVLTGRLDVPASDCLVYTHGHGYVKDLYGGLLTENASQAICRDLMVDAMLRYDAIRPGEIVLHVHDEIVAESSDPRDAIHTLCRVMSTPPAWAAGFPIEAKGFTGPRYTKSPFRDSVKAHYREGNEVSHAK